MEYVDATPLVAVFHKMEYVDATPLVAAILGG